MQQIRAMSIKDISTADLLAELLTRMTPPPTAPLIETGGEPLKTIMSQCQFCKLVGIDNKVCEQIRKLGYFPSYGTNPIKIPTRLGIEGVEQYFIDAHAGKLGENAKYKG